MQFSIVFVLPSLFFLFAIYQLDDRRFQFISLFATLYYFAFLLPYLLPPQIYSQWLALYNNHPTVFSALLLGENWPFMVSFLGLMGLYFGLVLAIGTGLVSKMAELEMGRVENEPNSGIVTFGILIAFSTLLFVFDLNGRSQFARAVFELPMVMSIVLLIQNQDTRHRVLGLAGLSVFCLLAILETRATKLAFLALLFLLFQMKFARVRLRLISLVCALVFLFLFLKPLARLLKIGLDDGQQFSGLLAVYIEQVNQNFVTLLMLAFDRIFSASSLSAVIFSGQPPNPAYLLAGLWSVVPGSLFKSKPTIYETGQSFGHDFGILGDYDLSTAINLPSTVQFYIVAGGFGVFLGMMCLAVVIVTVSSTIAGGCSKRSNPIFLACALFFLANIVFTLDRSISTIGGGGIVAVFTFGALYAVAAFSECLCRLWRRLFRDIAFDK